MSLLIIPKIQTLLTVYQFGQKLELRRGAAISVDGNENEVGKMLLNSTCKKGGFFLL